MTTRYTADPANRFNVPGLPSGYKGKSLPDGITVPSVGIEDVDRALFKLFNEEIPLTVSGEGTSSVRVPVVFAAGEKWALSKRSRALRDRNNTLILPLITVVRTSITQTPNSDIAGRGINQQTGEIVVHRRLDKSDRGYQGLINRMLIKHQENLAVGSTQADTDQLTTLRDIGDLENDPVVRQGGLLVPDRKNNVYETIVVPSPQFYTAQYDVTFWTQYTTHMNQLLEQLLSSFLPQGNSWRLETPKGYWFVASVDANTYTAETNTDDYAQAERLVRYKFIIKVPAYVLASSVPGAPVPIKRYVSSPKIEFQVAAGSDVDASGVVDDMFLGADDPTLPVGTDPKSIARRDQRNANNTRLYPSNQATNPDDPAVSALARGTSPARFRKVTGIDSSGRLVTKLFRVRSENRATGETVLSDPSLGGFTIVIAEG